MGQWKINIKLLPVKAHYFFYFGGTAALWPFITVFAKQMGISSKGIGIIFAIAPLIGLVSKIFFGYYADRHKKKKNIFLMFILLNLMSYLCVAFLPQSIPERPVGFDCGIGESYLRHCSPSNSRCNATLFKALLSDADPEHEKRVTDIAQEGENKRSVLFDNEVLEVCHVQCHINSFIRGRNFCQSIANNNSPPMCESAFPTTNNTSLNTNSVIKSKSSNEVEEESDDPYILKFTTWIKITHHVFDDIDSCIFLPIEYLSFRPEHHELLGFSCVNPTHLPKCFVDCLNNTALNSYFEVIFTEEDILNSRNFWLYGSLIVIGWVAMAVVTSIGDALCFETLGEDPHLYGVQRQWGAIGWGAISLIAGFLIDSTSKGKLLKDYTPCFYLVGAFLFFDLVVSYKWNIKEKPKPKSMRKDLWSLITDVKIIVFIFGCFFVGMCTGLLWNFLFWLIEDISQSESCDNGYGIKLLQGLITAVQCFGGEWPFFYFSGAFIKKLGHTHCMTLVLVAFGLRFIIYALLNNPWAFLPVELFQGLTFGVFYSVMASYANQVSQERAPGTTATLQGIFGGVFEGCGVAAGSLVGGLLVEKISSKTTFLTFGIGTVVIGFLHFLVMLCLQRDPVYSKIKLNMSISVEAAEQEGQVMVDKSCAAQEVDSE